MNVQFSVETPIPNSARVRQLESMFDVPRAERSRLEWAGTVDLDTPWSVGLVVGPSGSGKSTLARQLWPAPAPLEWGAGAVVDDFAKSVSMETIADVCQAVGFNTIPAWMRPHHVLSTGEQFRVGVARALVEAVDGLVVMDEFTSVVDRQVARITAHAIQKYVRRREGAPRFVAITCHYDVIDWLQPDWIVEMPQLAFERRAVQPRPALDCRIERVPYEAWRTFAPFHYLTAHLHRAAQCFVLSVDGRPASFAATMHFPHPTAKNITSGSRVVTLPDWQGMGLALALVGALGAAYRTVGRRFRGPPDHPAFILSFDRSPDWALVKRPGFKSTVLGPNSMSARRTRGRMTGSRPCAMFEYVGPRLDADPAWVRGFLQGEPGHAVEWNTGMSR